MISLARLIPIAAPLAAAVLSGCASMGYGHNATHCEANPNAPNCQGPIATYKDTESKDFVPSSRSEPQKRGAETTDPYEADPTESRGALRPPEMDAREPVRMPAQVMRIWVAPWQDTSGALNMPGYIYTEVTKRRWVVGEKPPDTHARIRPLQIEQKASDKYGPTGGRPKKAGPAENAPPALGPNAGSGSSHSSQAESAKAQGDQAGPYAPTSYPSQSSKSGR